MKRIGIPAFLIVLLLALWCSETGFAQTGVSSNVALAANGGVASASSTISAGFPVSAINNNERAGANWGNGGGWNDATGDTFPDWAQINFSASKTIDHVVVYTLQDNFTSPVEPTDTMTFSQWGIVNFTVQGWTGSTWTTLGTVTNNNLVKRTVAFAPYTTSRIRVNVSSALGSYSRITEIEAWTASITTLASSLNPSTTGTAVTFTATVLGSAPTGSVNFTDGGTTIPGCSAVALSGSGNSKTAQCMTSGLTVGSHAIVASYSGDATNPASNNNPALTEVVNVTGVNVALASNGGVASASSTINANFPVSAINNNERAGANWGSGGGWNDNTANTFPDWVQINFNGAQSINRVIAYTLQDNYANPVEPTDTMTFSAEGVTAFTVQGWTGSAWTTLGTVSGNNLVKRTVQFTAFTTDRVRINITAALDQYSRITEVEAWTAVSDQPPAVILSAPANNATFNAPATITLTATASDPDGTVAKVDFYNGQALLGTTTTSPYSFTWSNVPANSYTLTAKATDNLGAATVSSAATITVCAPTVALTSPPSSQFVAPPGSFALAATATTPPACGTINRVEFYNGTTLLGSATTAPYTYSWGSVPTGAYSLTAKAYDSRGLTATSAAIPVTVDATPVVSLTAPSNGATFTAPATINLTATASDSDGTISSLAFLSNGAVIATKTTTPYSFSWTGVAAGSYQLAARAIDNLQGTTTTAVNTVVVANPPTVFLSNPTTGQVKPPNASITVAASPAADTTHGRSVTTVAFAAKNAGGTVVWSATAGSPYSSTWTPSTSGNYTLTATVTDSAGATGTSPVVAIAVDLVPVVSVASDRQSYSAPATIQLTATASDTDGTIQNVTFYANGSSIGVGSPAGGNTYSLTWLNNVLGAYSVTAKATDNLAVTTTSTAITVSVVQSGPTIVYYHNDLSGSPLAATDSNGTVIWNEAYAPFGERYLNEDATDRNAIWFAGKPTEDAAGLSYFGGRWYNPTVGRFYSVDPQRFRDDNPLSFNRYAYANNNPYRFIDPNGHSPLDIGFLAWDLAKLGVALYNGSGLAEAAIDAGISAAAVAIPVPGVGLAIKAERAARAAKAAEGVIAKEVTLSRRVNGEAAQHAADAIQSGKPDVLTINRPGAAANRIESLKGVDKVPDKHLDEYPPAMFKEGGAGASVRPISPRDNMSAGACLGNACRGLPDGTRVRIKVED
jgi:RHS repeat-associated protein